MRGGLGDGASRRVEPWLNRWRARSRARSPPNDATVSGCPIRRCLVPDASSVAATGTDPITAPGP